MENRKGHVTIPLLLLLGSSFLYGCTQEAPPVVMKEAGEFTLFGSKTILVKQEPGAGPADPIKQTSAQLRVQNAEAVVYLRENVAALEVKVAGGDANLQAALVNQRAELAELEKWIAGHGVTDAELQRAREHLAQLREQSRIQMEEENRRSGRRLEE